MATRYAKTGSEQVDKEQEPQEPREPGGRNTHKPGEMPSEDLAAAYGHAARLRAHEVDYQLDLWLGNWMKDVRYVLARRGHLDRVREFLPVYFDPSRRQAVFGPGGTLVPQGAIERAIQPVKPVRAIAAG
jgi:hypothetical protein